MNTQHEQYSADQLLIQGLKSRDQQAMASLYSNYYPMVYSKCLSFVKDHEDAHDLAQDVFLKIFEKIHSFKGESRLSTWIYSLTFNYCTDQLRRKKYIDPFLVDWRDNGVEIITVGDQEDRGWLEVAELCFLSLPSEDYQLLSLKYKDGKSLFDLQQIYGISLSAVKMRLSRAKEKACKLLREQMAAAA